MSGLVISMAKQRSMLFMDLLWQGSWSLQWHVLLRSWDFKYLGRSESGGLGSLLRQLPHEGQGAGAKPQASFGRLGCSTLVPMLRRLFSIVVARARFCNCEIWASQCLGKLGSDAKKLQGVQIAQRNVCGRSPVGSPAAAIPAKFVENQCSSKWWLQPVQIAVRV